MKLKKFAAWLLVCASLAPLSAIAAPLTVTKEALNCTITGADTAEPGSKYTYTITPAPAHILAGTHIEVEGMPKNLNNNEGFSTTSTYLPEAAPAKNNAGVSIVPDEDSPMAGLLPYKRVITKYLGGGSVTNTRTTAFSALKGAKSYSFGFWLKDETAINIYRIPTADRPMKFSMYYAKNATDAAKMVDFSVPILSLDQVGESATLNIAVGDASVYKTGAGSATCLAKSTANGSSWSYYMVEIKDITYNSAYATSNPTLYSVFTNVNDTLAKENARIEMSNFTMLFEDTITEPFMVYPDKNRSYAMQVPSRGNIPLTFPPRLQALKFVRKPTAKCL